MNKKLLLLLVAVLFPLMCCAQESFEDVKKMAEAGNAEAQYVLGICYVRGAGVEENERQAIFWLKKAAEQGYEDAHGLLERLRVKYSRNLPIYAQDDCIFTENQPFCLKCREGYPEVNEVDGKIEIKNIGKKIELIMKQADNVTYDYRESDGVDQIINEKLIPYLSIPDNTELIVEYMGADDFIKVATYKNGVFRGREELAQEQRNIDQANQKEHDKLVAYWTNRLGFNPEGRTTKQIIKVGAPFQALCDFYKGRTFVHFDLFKQDGNYKYYRILNGSVNWEWVGVVGDKVRSISWSGNEL